MRSPEQVLKALNKHGKVSDYKFERLYRILFNEEMFHVAYQRIYAKPGNMTPGTDGKTINRMSLQRISKYIVMENVLLLEIKQLYDSLVAAPYGEYVHGYGTQKPNGFKYKSNAQTLFNKVVELNEKCRPSYIDEQTIFQLSHTLEKEVEHVVGTYEEAIKPNAAQKRWQELDDKMNRATRQIHLDIYSLLSYIEETSHE